MSKILVIDDEDSFRYMLRRILEKEGHWVCEAVDGETGIERASSHQPELIIVDWLMPKKDGLQVCRKLKENTATRHIPIALLTGKRIPEEEKDFWQDTEVDLYISKPIDDIRAFLRMITGLLHGLSGRRARDVAQFGALIVNRKERVVSFNGKVCDRLPTKVFDLLYFLVKKAPQTASRLYLMEKIWGKETSVKDREVDVMVCRLKKLMPELSSYVENIPSVGYALSNAARTPENKKIISKLKEVQP